MSLCDLKMEKSIDEYILSHKIILPNCKNVNNINLFRLHVE